MAGRLYIKYRSYFIEMINVGLFFISIMIPVGSFEIF